MLLYLSYTVVFVLSRPYLNGTRRFRNFGSFTCVVHFTQNIYQNIVRQTPKQFNVS